MFGSYDKATIIKMLQWTIIDMHERNEKLEIFMKEIANLGKETEAIKKNQMEILELKNTIFKIRKTSWIVSTEEWREQKNQWT